MHGHTTMMTCLKSHGNNLKEYVKEFTLILFTVFHFF